MRLSATVFTLLLPLLAAAAPDNINGNAFGTPTAPIVVEVFSDFQCPACKRLHDEELPLLMRDYVMPGKVYLVYRYFPLPMHPYGRLAAEVACACAQFGKYGDAANRLFATQSAWANDGKVMETVGSVLTPAERSKLPTLLKQPVVQNQINRDLEKGRSLPVQSTPTLLLTYREKRYPLAGAGALNYNLVKVLLDDLLSRK
jgi:protein-disulfide isomerase